MQYTVDPIELAKGVLVRKLGANSQTKSEITIINKALVELMSRADSQQLKIGLFK